MINEILDGISEAINQEFGETYEIYTESVGQGLKEPCFSVLCVSPANDQFLGKRYFKTNLFCVHYFPEGAEKNREINAVRERLFNCLELINVKGDLCRGTRMRAESSDGVLSFFVKYDMFIYKEQEKLSAMEDYGFSSDVKG